MAHESQTNKPDRIGDDIERRIHAAAPQIARLLAVLFAPAPAVAPVDDWLEVAKLPADLRTPARRAIKSGELAGSKPGRALLVRRSDLDAWIASRKPGTKAPTAEVGQDHDCDPFDAALASGRLRRTAPREGVRGGKGGSR